MILLPYQFDYRLICKVCKYKNLIQKRNYDGNFEQ